MLTVTYNQMEELSKENRLSLLCDIKVNCKDVGLSGSIDTFNGKEEINLYYRFTTTGNSTSMDIEFIPKNWDYLEDEFAEVYVDQLDEQEIVNLYEGVGEVTDRVWETPSYNKYWRYFTRNGNKIKVDIQHLELNM